MRCLHKTTGFTHEQEKPPGFAQYAQKEEYDVGSRPPWGGVTGVSTKMGVSIIGKTNRRRQKKHRVPKGVFVGVGPDFVKLGPIEDVSMDGLEFRYICDGEPSNGSYVEIFMTDGDFYLGRVPIKTVADVQLVNKSAATSTAWRHCSLRFTGLTGYQRTKLEEFIDSRTIKQKIGDAL